MSDDVNKVASSDLGKSVSGVERLAPPQLVSQKLSVSGIEALAPPALPQAAMTSVTAPLPQAASAPDPPSPSPAPAPAVSTPPQGGHDA